MKNEMDDIFKGFPKTKVDRDDKDLWKRVENLRDNILLFLYSQSGNLITLSDIKEHVLNKSDSLVRVEDEHYTIIDTALLSLKDYELVEVNIYGLSLSSKARIFFDTQLPRCKFNKPFSYFLEKERIKALAENRQNWKKVNWLKIAIFFSAVTLIAGLLSGMYLEKWKSQNLSGKKQEIPSKSEHLK